MKTNTKHLITALSALTLAFAPSAAKADNTTHSGFLGLSLGYYDILDDQDGVDIRAEYRPHTDIVFKGLKPWIGLEATFKGTLWAGAGLLYELNLTPKWHIIPSFGAGLYHAGTRDLNLDNTIQFRSQIEIARTLENDSRISLSFSHMSNAGLGNHNPGTEVLSLGWQIPINKLKP